MAQIKAVQNTADRAKQAEKAGEMEATQSQYVDQMIEQQPLIQTENQKSEAFDMKTTQGIPAEETKTDVAAEENEGEEELEESSSEIESESEVAEAQ